MKAHNYSFFGKKTALILKSPSRHEPHIFITCIKDKGDGTWEKPSLGEGKTISLNLEELASVKSILHHNTEQWSAYHAYKGSKTQIRLNWDRSHENLLWISIGEYRKTLRLANIEIMKALITHLFKEKIEYATGSPNGNSSNHKAQHKAKQTNNTENKEPPNDSKNPTPPKTESLNGIFKDQNENSVLIYFLNGSEIAVPHSKIHSTIIPDAERVQEITIEEGFLKKFNLM